MPIIIGIIVIVVFGLVSQLLEDKKTARIRQEHEDLILKSELYKKVMDEINCRREQKHLIVDCVAINAKYTRISVYSTEEYRQVEVLTLEYSKYGYAPLQGEQTKEFIDTIFKQMNVPIGTYKVIRGGSWEDDYCDYIEYCKELPKKPVEGKSLY